MTCLLQLIQRSQGSATSVLRTDMSGSCAQQVKHRPSLWHSFRAPAVGRTLCLARPRNSSHPQCSVSAQFVLFLNLQHFRRLMPRGVCIPGLRQPGPQPHRAGVKQALRCAFSACSLLRHRRSHAQPPIVPLLIHPSVCRYTLWRCAID